MYIGWDLSKFKDIFLKNLFFSKKILKYSPIIQVNSKPTLLHSIGHPNYVSKREIILLEAALYSKRIALIESDDLSNYRKNIFQCEYSDLLNNIF